MNTIEFGEGCQIGDLVSIFGCDFHEINPVARNQSAGEIVSVAIGNNVRRGSRVVILKGVTIGENTVVAAGSVVTKPLPVNVIAAAAPAKIVKKIELH